MGFNSAFKGLIGIVTAVTQSVYCTPTLAIRTKRLFPQFYADTQNKQPQLHYNT